MGKEESLRDKVVRLCTYNVNEGVEKGLLKADGKELKELDAIFDVLKKIKDRMPPEDGAAAAAAAGGGGGGAGGEKKQDDDGGDKILPQSKREELAMVLPLIERALNQRRPNKAAQPEAPEADEHPSQTTTEPITTGCNPCKPRWQGQMSKQQTTEAAAKEEGGGALVEAPSLKLLLGLTQSVLEPEQYYEWSTSYVDESLIYGFDDAAGEVADALLKSHDDDDAEQSPPSFLAAAITGIHGSGKTALAHKVFVHDKAKDHFALRLWVCVGPPDSEDRFGLLYRMLDNLGLDTAKLEDDIVYNASVVKKAREEEEARILREDEKVVADLRKKAQDEAAKPENADDQEGTSTKKPDAGEAKHDAKEEAVGAGQEPAAHAKEADIFKRLLREKADDCDAVRRSKIGVLLYILHMTLSKTSYLVVFDDIRVYGKDDWYTNLTRPPPEEGEWGGRLAYGLPKDGQHRGAVLVTCRLEDDAKTMVRTGRVFRPPQLTTEHGWKLFDREYNKAIEKQVQDGGGNSKQDGGKAAFLKELEEMKEVIVNKCLGLPIAIAEAANGFAALGPLSDDDSKPAEKPAATPAAAAAAAAAEDQKTTQQTANVTTATGNEGDDAQARQDSDDN